MLSALRARHGFHQVVEQGFGAIEQARAHESSPSSNTAWVAFIAQSGAGDEVLVHADGAVHLAALAEQVAEAKWVSTCPCRLRDMQEDFDGLVRLFVQQEIEPRK